jgi:hypothetical protein
MRSVAEPISLAGTGARPAVDDRALLRAHQPVLRFTDGELVLPTSVAGYVAQCSLWAGRAAALHRSSRRAC